MHRSSSVELLQNSGTIWTANASNSLERHYNSPKKWIAPFGDQTIDQQLPAGGLTAGALHEWFGSSELLPLTVVNLLVGNAITNRINGFQNLSSWNSSISKSWNSYILSSWNSYILYIGRECWPSPYVLQKTLPHPALISACLFIDVASEEDRMWALDTALRSEASFAVIAYLPKLTVPQSKRFSLAIANSNRFAFLFRPPEEQKSSTATATRWKAEPYLQEEKLKESPSQRYGRQRYRLTWQLELLKQKGQQSKQRKWIVQLEEEFFSDERYRINNTKISNTISSNTLSRMVNQHEYARKRLRSA